MKRDVWIFLLFLVLATLIWYGHAMQSVRNTRVPVYIQYTGKPGSIGLAGEGLPDHVMIEVRDAGARLNTYHREPLRLTIDLRQYIHGEKGTIHVPSDALRRSISDILQGTSRLIETTPEDITCIYFTEQEKSVPLSFNGQIHLAPEYQLVGEPSLGRSQMMLYGQDRALNGIDTLYTEPLDLQNVSDTLIRRVALAIPKGMRGETDSVDLCIITERFTEKKFMRPIRVHGVPAGYTIHVFPEEVEVSVRVAMSHFAKVQPEDVQVKSIYTADRTETLDVELEYSNPYITTAWTYPGVVEFLLEQ